MTVPPQYPPPVILRTCAPLHCDAVWMQVLDPPHVQEKDHGVTRLPPEHSISAAEFQPQEPMFMLGPIEHLLPRSIVKLLALLYEPTHPYAFSVLIALKQEQELVHVSCGRTKLHVEELASYVAFTYSRADV